MTSSFTLELVVLVADADQREIARALLESRAESLGIRTLRHQILKHSRRDPGCFHEAEALLQPFLTSAEHAIVLFDREGCGQEDSSADEIANTVRARLAGAGWTDRADVIVIDPEIENWVWSASPHVATTLGWKDPAIKLRDWMRDRGLWSELDVKPPRPKEALEAVLVKTKVRHSASLYGELARKVSLQGCVDPAFSRLTARLSSWFGPSS